jgi:Zn-dependent M16 (insulinase) family peptidase
MTNIHGFERVRGEDITEFKTRAELFKHVKTGAELLSLTNDDENKAFGITFRIPAQNSTGVAHILEHSVFCGSRKYPVKDPFLELLKGSLQTFLNAYNYTDSTSFLTASQNAVDFYNLIDVILDSVFHPLLNPFIFQIEGWRCELEKANHSLVYKGIVLSEMKGYHSTPEILLTEYSRQSLFPDTPYSFNSGGDPKEIPNLTFMQLKEFHNRYYHPSNARIYFYGNDNSEKRFRIVNGYLKDFKERKIDTTIRLQQSFNQHRRFIRFFSNGNTTQQVSKGMATMNWVLDKTIDWEKTLAFLILEYILIGMPASPLRKALIDSNYGEALVGEGLNVDLRQSYFSIGLKGIDPNTTEKLEALILETLAELTRNGIDPCMIEAAVNTIEFNLRENNFGAFPRGLQLMQRALITWLSNGDPLTPLTFEAPLETIKSQLRQNKPFFETLIDRYFLDNNHRTTLIMKPHQERTQRNEDKEKERFAAADASVSEEDLEEIITAAKKLKEFQETPDTPEALATIPILKISDLDRKNKLIPLAAFKHKGVQLLHHDLFTNGIVYLSLGFNLHMLPPQYLPYVRLFARILLGMGTETEDHLALTLRMNRTTGGIRPGFFNSSIKGSKGSTSWLYLQGKAMVTQIDNFLGIYRDILLHARLDNRERFRQMVKVEISREERKLVPAGHQIVNSRMSAHFIEAGQAGELMNGVSYLLFLRKLVQKIDTDWMDVLSIFEDIRRILINRKAILLNVTLDRASWEKIHPKVNNFIDSLPVHPVSIYEWNQGKFPYSEGLIIPAQINFVGKAANLYEFGYDFHGSSLVISRYLRTTWLWEQIRVKGGAYEAHCYFDRLSGVFSLVSVRDPNITKTIEAFDKTAHFLKNIKLSEDELTKSIIGTISDIDQYKLPDAKGYTSMMRFLTGVTNAERQLIREDILGTTAHDFRAFGEVLEFFTDSGFIKVLGSESAIREAMGKKMKELELLKVL